MENYTLPLVLVVLNIILQQEKERRPQQRKKTNILCIVITSPGNIPTLDMYGMSLNLEFLYASSPLMKLSSKGASATGVFII